VLSLDAQILLHHRGILWGLLYYHVDILTKESKLNIMNHELINLVTELGSMLQKKGLKLAVAESCTGGGICQLVTSCAGSSQWFDCGFVTYSNNAKIKMLGVKAETLALYGAVSQPTALEMAQGVLNNSEADCTIAVTGVAGPSGGSVEKPVGTVFIAVQNRQRAICYENHFVGTRHEIREQAIKFGLEALLKIMRD
jgi:nicotinamide-nucleotide amidase